MSGEVQAGAVLGGLAESEQLEEGRPRRTPRGRRIGLGDWLLPVYSVIAFTFLLIPIVYTFVFSFNDSIKSNISWRGFTFDKWLNVCNVEGGAVCEAFANSIVIGLVATVVATALGTMIAIALVRYRFRARSSISLLLFLPMATPEVVLGAGLAAQFLAVGVPKDMTTIILAHTMFCISFVVVTVRARVASLDPALEEAGRDLYAGGWTAFRKITFPLSMPGVVAGSVLVFIPSLGAYVIPAILGGSNTVLLGDYIVSQFLSARNWPFGSALSTAVMIVMLAATIFYFRRGGRTL